MMENSDAWAHSFARQAAADLRALELYELLPDSVAAECHKLLFLQMACEKLCKAFVIKAKVHTPERSAVYSWVHQKTLTHHRQTGDELRPTRSQAAAMGI